MIPSVHPSPISGGRLPYGPFCIRSASSFAAASNASFSLSNSSLHSSGVNPPLESSSQRNSSIAAKVSGGQSVAGTAPALSAQISSTGSSLPRAANRLSIISSEENTSAIHSLALALATSAANLSVSASAVPFSRAQTWSWLSIIDKSSIKAPISSPVTPEKQEASRPPNVPNKSRSASFTVSGSWSGHISAASKSLNLSDPVKRSPKLAPSRASESQARLSTHLSSDFMACIANLTSKFSSASSTAATNAFHILLQPTFAPAHFGVVISNQSPSGI